MDRAKTLIPDFYNEKFRDELRRPSPQELADLSRAFGFDFDSKRYEQYKKLIGFHPGAYISEIMKDENITKEEFADRLGVSIKEVSKLINGKENVTSELADKLEKVIGVSSKTWLALQDRFDTYLKEFNKHGIFHVSSSSDLELGIADEKNGKVSKPFDNAHDMLEDMIH